MRNNRSPIRGWLPWLVYLSLLSPSFATDPLVPTEVRPTELLRQEPKEPGFHAGIFDVHFGLGGGLTYDDNISLSATNRQSDFIGRPTADILAVADDRADGVGTLLSLQYQPTGELFYQHTHDDALDQFARLQALWAMPKLTLGVAQQFTETSDAVIEIGRRVRQDYYNTDLTTQYKFSEKTSLEVDPRLTVSEGQSVIGSKEWAVDTFLNWAATAKLTPGIGGSFGYVDVDQGPSQHYERALARLIYTATAKLDFTASAGGEWRHYNSGLSPAVTPVFGLAGTYRPSDYTTLTLEGHRREEPSLILTGQDYITTGGTGEIRQRVWRMYFISLSGGYDLRDYRASEVGALATRRDHYYFGRAGIGAEYAHHWNVLVFCQHQRDDSNVDTQDFKDNQVGFQTAWTY